MPNVKANEEALFNNVTYKNYQMFQIPAQSDYSTI